MLTLYNIFFLIGTLSITGLMIFILTKASKSLTTTYFLLTLASGLVMGIAQFLGSLTSDLAMYDHAIDFYHLGITLLPIFFLLFTLSYLGKRRLVTDFAFLTLLFLPALTMIYVFWDTPVKATMNPWGLGQVPDLIFNIHTVYINVIMIFVMFLLGHRALTAKDKESKRQAGLIFASLLTLLIGGTITEGILPALGYKVVPLGITFTTIMSATIAWTIVRTRLFVLSPEIIVENISATIPGALIVLDYRGKINYVNHGAQLLFGYDEKSLHEKTLSDLFTKPLNLRKNVPIWNEEAQILTGAGIVVSIAVYGSEVKDNHGNMLGDVVIITDLTEIKLKSIELEKTLHALEESQELLKKEKESVEQKVIERTDQLARETARLQSSINSLNVGFVITDTDSEIFLINSAAKKIIYSGTTPEHVNISDIEKKFEEGIDIKAQIASCITQKEVFEAKSLLTGTQYFHIFISPITISKNSEQEVIGTVMLLEDITEAKVLERSKDEFFTIASHELRTPLATIKGTSSLIEQFYGKTFKDPELKEMVSNIRHSSERLLGIVNDFLDMSKLEQGKIVFNTQRIDASVLIEAVVEEYQTISSQRKLTLTFQKPQEEIPMVLADTNKLKQVLLNLIGNALNFTEKGGATVSLLVLPASPDGRQGFVKVLVSDTGRGIPASNQNLLFHKFQQAGSSLLTRDTTKGTGLGLYISRLIVEGMGGKIKLEHSEDGKGSTFSFTIPIAANT